MKSESITIYSYSPTMIFSDLWMVEFFKHDIFYVPFLFFFKRRVRRTTRIFNCMIEKGGTNHGQEWLRQHPEIKLSEYKEEYRKLKEVK